MIQVTLSCDASGCEETLVLASDRSEHQAGPITEVDFGAYDGESPGGWVDGTWHAPDGWSQTPDNKVACPRHRPT